MNSLPSLTGNSSSNIGSHTNDPQQTGIPISSDTQIESTSEATNSKLLKL